MQGRVTIELFKEAMKFSAGHFTIFSATRRENLHGHNFSVHVEITAAVSDNGITFDYGPAKERLIELCHGLNEIVLLPAKSPHLRVHEEGGQVIAAFADERIVFLKRDVKLLPIRNVTIEELSSYLLETIVAELAARAHDPEDGVSRVAVRVLSGPGQSALTEWTPT